MILGHALIPMMSHHNIPIIPLLHMIETPMKYGLCTMLNAASYLTPLGINQTDNTLEDKICIHIHHPLEVLGNVGKRANKFVV